MAIDPKWAEQSRQKMDIIAQMEAQYALERAASQAEQDAFMARVQATREAIANGAKVDMSTVPTLDEIYRAKRAEEVAAAEAAEQARIAALTPRDIWLSTLSFQERNHIAKWEQINRMEYPMPAALQPSR